jgi:transposase
MYYCGIDAHIQYLRIAVLDKDGNLVLERSVSCSEPEQLVAALAPYRPLRAVVETCPSWPWLHELLTGAGVDFRLAHARHLRMIAHNAQKNDEVDARLLARMLLAGLIPEAFPRVSAQREQLRLVRHHRALVRQRTLLVNRIHAQLHEQRLIVQREWLLRQAGRQWLVETAWPRLTGEQQQLVQTHLEVIEVLNRNLRELRKRIIRAAEGSAEARLLRSIPGIGAYWSLLLAGELLPIHRFRRPEHLVSYAGLAPTTSSSGGHTSHGPIPKAANRAVREAFVSAVAVHARRAPDSPVSKQYEALRQRLGWRKARVAAARKLARIAYQMLYSGKPWRTA